MKLDNQDTDLKFSAKVRKFDNEIKRFDALLDRILKVLPQDVELWDRVSECRDAVFRLQQQLRGCKIVEFASSGLDDMTYQATLNELFWDRNNKQRDYDDDDDEGMKDEEGVLK